MRFDGGRGHPQFDLSGAVSQGPKTVVRAAKDPVSPPTEPVIVSILESTLCQCKVGDNCFVVWNPYHEERDVPYDATVAEWNQICTELLASALARNDE